MAKLTIKGGTNPITIGNAQDGAPTPNRGNLDILCSGETYREESATPLQMVDPLMAADGEFINIIQRNRGIYSPKTNGIGGSINSHFVSYQQRNAGVVYGENLNKTLRLYSSTSLWFPYNIALAGCTCTNSNVITTTDLGNLQKVRVGSNVFHNGSLLGTITNIISSNQFQISSTTTLNNASINIYVTEGIDSPKSSSYVYINNSNMLLVLGNSKISSNNTEEHGEVYTFNNQLNGLSQLISNPDGLISGNLFGEHVLVSGDKNVFFVSAPSLMVEPKVHVFTKPGAYWTRLTTISAIDYQQQGKFGYTTSCSDDGSNIAISEPNYNSTTISNSGRVHVYDQTGPTTWVRNDVIYNPEHSKRFGHLLKMTSNGNRLAICSESNVYIYERNISDEWDNVYTIHPPVGIPRDNVKIKNISYNGIGSYMAVTYSSTEYDIVLNKQKIKQYVCVFRKGSSHWFVEDILDNNREPPLYRSSIYTAIAKSDGILSNGKYNDGVYGSVGELNLLRGNDVNLGQVFDLKDGQEGIYITFNGVNYTQNNYIQKWYFGHVYDNGSGGILDQTNNSVTSINYGSNIYNGDSTFYLAGLPRLLPNSEFSIAIDMNDPSYDKFEIDDGFGDQLYLTEDGKHLYVINREPSLLIHYVTKKYCNNLIVDIGSHVGTIPQYKDLCDVALQEHFININLNSNIDMLIMMPPSDNPTKYPLFFFKKYNDPYIDVNENLITYERNRYFGMKFTNVSTGRGSYKLQEMKDSGLATMGIRQYVSNSDSYGDYQYHNAEFNTPYKKYISAGFNEDMKNLQIISYIGDGTSERSIPHALGQEPSAIIIKRTRSSSSNDDDWVIWHKDIPNGTVLDNTINIPRKIGASFNMNYRKPTSTEFYVFGEASQNLNDEHYIAVIITDGPNKQVKTGSYIGNGGSQNILSYSTPLHPSFMMVKNISSNSPWCFISRHDDALFSSGDTATIECDSVSGYKYLSNVVYFNNDRLSYMNNNLNSMNSAGSQYIYIMFIGDH
jgi:hypothetical protein